MENKKRITDFESALFAVTEDDVISSPDFLSLKKEERQEYFDRYSILKDRGLSLEFVEDYSRSFYNVSKAPIEKILEKSVEYLIGDTSKDQEGGWYLVTEDFLYTLRDDLKSKIEDFVRQYKEKNQTHLLPTPWTNSLVILLLEKWLSYKKYNDEGDADLSGIEKAIETGREWLRKSAIRESEGGLTGWVFFDRRVSNKVHAFETCISLIALNYNPVSDFSIDPLEQPFFGEEYIGALLQPLLRCENGASKIEENGEIDSGATSYTALCLMRYYEGIRQEARKNEVESHIRKSIDWLIDNQKTDNGVGSGSGWGEKGKDYKDESKIEKTVYALLALSKYRNTFPEISVNGHPSNDSIQEGVSFLNSRMSRFGSYIYGWPNDYNKELPFDIRNSSLAISALLRCDVPYYNSNIMQGINGISRIHHKMKFDKKKMNDECVYFYCMLADYLKAIEMSS